jgi:major membrane immunogen (membrane-anchored lipoprotein)
VDESGAQVFAADDDAIGDIPVDVVKEIADAVLKVSAPGSVEKVAKN